MASTTYSDRGTDVNKLSDKQRLFVDQYLVDQDATKAAIRAGYSVKSANAIGNKLIKDPRVARAIGKAAKEVHEELTLTTTEVLKQLYYIVTRDVREFVDENGDALPISQLGDRAAQSVDGFDQEITYFTNYETGDVTKTVKNKLKLVGKAGAIDMAMKYQGLFNKDNEQKKDNITLDFSGLFKPPAVTDDPVTKAIAALEETAANQITIEVSPEKKPLVKNKPTKSKERKK